MYRIIAYESPTDKTGHVVFDPHVNRYISDGKLNLKESEIDDLSLTVNQANYLFGNVRPLQTHVEVYQDDSLLFRGRALDLTREMKDSGQFIQSFVFESIQNYLQDTSQRWAKVQNTTPKQFFQRLINTHNSQVPEYKRFTVRTVDVTNSTDNVYRYIEDGATTWDTIKDKLVSRLGGFIRIEYVNGVNYIDYLQSPGKEHNNDTPIIIGKNLQSASVQVDPTEVITQLVPLGATIENNNTTTDTEVSQPRIDIKSVNGGQDYLDIPDLQAEFGIIRKSVQWDDVHEPKILLTKAKQWITKQTAAKESWTVNALELPQLESFKVSDRYLFNNKAVASPQMLRVSSKTIDLLHWQKSTLTIGDKQNKLSNYQLENASQLRQANKFNQELKARKKELENLKTDLEKKYNKLSEDGETLAESNKELQEKIEKLQKQLDELNNGGGDDPAPPPSTWKPGTMFMDIADYQRGFTQATYNDLFAKGVKGLIIKLTQGSEAGTAYINSYFNEQKNRALIAGMKFIGTYHYLVSTSVADAQDEARWYLKQLQTNNVPKSTIVACDLEDPVLTTNKATLTAELAAFHKVLADAGYTNTADYSSTSWMTTRFDSKGKYKWIASWGLANPPVGADAWQFNSTFNGMSLDVDRSYNKAFI